MRATLRPCQQGARAAVAAGPAAGKRALFTVLPTGTSKTVLFAAEVGSASNRDRRPQAPAGFSQAGALTSLAAVDFLVVGEAGFEPATPCV